MIRMNWHDYENQQFIYNNETYPLYKAGRHYKTGVRSKILFLLNIYRGRFVSMNDIVEFVYYEVPLDDWPDDMENSIRTTMYLIRHEILPEGITIDKSYAFGYTLNINEE